MSSGFDIEAAVRDKYQIPPFDTTPVENRLHQKLNIRFVQFVGMEKVARNKGIFFTFCVDFEFLNSRNLLVVVVEIPAPPPTSQAGPLIRR